MQTKEKILVVDDEAMVRRNCEKILTHKGYEVNIAESGEMALEKLRQQEFHVILMDLKMPGMDGNELLKIVRQEFPRIVPVIITGYATVDSAVQSMKEGAYDYIPKPFTTEELLLVVKNAMEKRSLIDQAEKLRREKEALILMVYHELKAPIASVHGYLQNVLQSPLPEKEMKMIARCYERTTGMIELVNDLLGMNRFLEKRNKNTFVTLRINEILPQFIEAVQDEISKNNITIHCSLPDELPLVKGNREDLQTAFVNLIRNSVRYNKPGGRIEIFAVAKEDSIAVIIADTGIGISADDLPRIFDEFFRIKNEQTRQITGTGLGLAIVKNIIEFHGGHIEVKSEVGKGSKFTVYLPAVL